MCYRCGERAAERLPAAVAGNFWAAHSVLLIELP